MMGSIISVHGGWLVYLAAAWHFLRMIPMISFGMQMRMPGPFFEGWQGRGVKVTSYHCIMYHFCQKKVILQDFFPTKGITR